MKTYLDFGVRLLQNREVVEGGHRRAVHTRGTERLLNIQLVIVTNTKQKCLFIRRNLIYFVLVCDLL